jgi:hypothetical protein
MRGWLPNEIVSRGVVALSTPRSVPCSSPLRDRGPAPSVPPFTARRRLPPRWRWRGGAGGRGSHVGKEEANDRVRVLVVRRLWAHESVRLYCRLHPDWQHLLGRGAAVFPRQWGRASRPPPERRPRSAIISGWLPRQATLARASWPSLAGAGACCTTETCKPRTAPGRRRGRGAGSALAVTVGGGCGPVRTISTGSPDCASSGVSGDDPLPLN